MKFGGAAALAAGVIALAGCGGGVTPAAETVTTTTTATATATATETTTATETVTETQGPAASAAEDPTEAFLAKFGREVWADQIVEVVREDGFTIRTAIVDPRGRDGSPAAEQALDICRAGQEVLEAEGMDPPRVRVMEADDSTFVLIGNTYPVCTEV